MIFLISTHRNYKFYKDSSVAIEVEGIDFVHTKIYREGDSFTQVTTSDPQIEDPMQAVAVLFEHGIPCYKTINTARDAAKELGLTTWKYLNINDYISP